MWNAAKAGDIDRAREIDAEITPAYEATSVTTNPIPLKAALAMLGLCEDRLRLPLVSADEEQRAAIKAGLDAAGVALAS
jgi:4-hydroxy-tetrahydrodipicolinate synthase